MTNDRFFLDTNEMSSFITALKNIGNSLSEINDSITAIGSTLSDDFIGVPEDILEFAGKCVSFSNEMVDNNSAIYMISSDMIKLSGDSENKAAVLLRRHRTNH